VAAPVPKGTRAKQTGAPLNPQKDGMLTARQVIIIELPHTSSGLGGPLRRLVDRDADRLGRFLQVTIERTEWKVATDG
jgi:hypothetical protein